MSYRSKHSRMFVVSLLLLLVGMLVVSAASMAAERPLEILTLSFFAPHRKAAELIAQQLQEVGINAVCVPLESAAFYGRVYGSHEFDMYVLSTVLEPNPARHLDWLNSALDFTPGSGGTNYVGFHNEELDRLMDTFASKSEEEAIADFHRMQAIVAAGIPFVNTQLPQEARIIRAEWEGYTRDEMIGGPFYILNRITPLNLRSKAGKSTFTMAWGTDIDTQNPLEAYNHRAAYILNTLIMEPLVTFGEGMELIPWLATDWEGSEDGLTWVLEIRDGVKWHDGEEMTTQDVTFSYNYFIEHDVPIFKANVEVIDSVEALDQKHVKFTLKEKDVFFLQTLAIQPIIPEHIWRDKEPTWSNPQPVGTGPFKWSDHVKDAYIELVRNDEYWQTGKPYLERFCVEVIPSADMRFMNIKLGLADTERYGSPPAMLKEAETNEELDVVVAAGYWDQHLGFNLRREPFNDVRFRTAIACAIDRDQIVNIGMGGYGTPRYLICHPGWHPSEWVNLEATFPEYDPERAKELLRECEYGG